MAKTKNKQPTYGYFTEDQFYKGIRVRLIPYHPDYYATKKAKRFELGERKYGQSIWIPNAYLSDEGVIKPGSNINFVFTRAIRQNKFQYARLDPSVFGYNKEQWGWCPFNDNLSPKELKRRLNKLGGGQNET